MELTVSQAARAARKSKSQISRMVKNGRISASKSADGRPVIDLSELQRVYPDAGLAQHEERSPPRNKGNRGNTGDNSAMRAELEGARRECELLRDQVADLRRDRDAWRAMAERVAAPQLGCGSRPVDADQPVADVGRQFLRFGLSHARREAVPLDVSRQPNPGADRDVALGALPAQPLAGLEAFRVIGIQTQFDDSSPGAASCWIWSRSAAANS